MMVIYKKEYSLIYIVQYVLVFVLLVGTGFCQITWIRTYEEPTNDFAYSVRQTADGGYIVTGKTDSYGSGMQVYLIRVDSLGDTLWIKTYGGPGGDRGICVKQTTDGGYILTGFESDEGIWHTILVKTDSIGDTLWTKLYNLPNQPSNSKGFSVQQTFDSGYIIAGYTNYPNSPGWEVLLIKADAEGILRVWKKIARAILFHTKQPLLFSPIPLLSLHCHRL